MIESMVLPVSCFDDAEGLPSVADKSIDHIITDPPYLEYVHAGNRRSQKKGGGVIAPEIPFAHLTPEEREAAAYEFVRTCRGWIIVCCDLEGVAGWVHDLTRVAGAKKRNTLVWHKTNCAPKFHGDGPAQACEAAVVAWAGKGKSRWNAGGMPGFYEAMAPRKERRHSTQKPLSLFHQLVADFTRPGELVVDPYMGGGTTGKACKQLGRRWAGFEIDPWTATDAMEEIDSAPELEVPVRARMSQTKARELGGVVMIGGKQVASFPVLSARPTVAEDFLPRGGNARRLARVLAAAE